ncbi:CFAP99 [Symbiodinium sp. CCMP2456]|nr:CFAP99 [Symbiodinium sp. CCMP2456]
MTGWQAMEDSRPTRGKRRSWLPACCSSQAKEGGDPRLDAVASTPSKEEDYMGPDVSNVGRGYDGEQGNINSWAGEEQLSPPQKEPESETTPVQAAQADLLASFERAATPEALSQTCETARFGFELCRTFQKDQRLRAVPVIAAKPSTASGEDFETATGLSLVRTKLERCMLKDHELPLSDVLQAKVCAIRAMAEATVAYKFENVKELHQAISTRVSEAVEVEDFSKAEEVYELQKLAEDCLKGFELDERQGGSADLTAGAISLGPASSLGLLEGDFTVEFWMRCHVDVSARTPLLTGDPSIVGSFPSLYVKPGGGLQLDFAGGNSYSSRMRLQQTKKWMHVAISYSFSPSDNDFKVSLFQDGLQVEFGSEIWAVNMDSELRLGPFPGKLAEFRVWDHARAADEVELWMTRRCQGDEPGLCCCLSLRPARGLSDSTLDPGKALASGHFFADRGAFDGPVTWDGDCPSLLDDPAEDESVGDCRECGQKYTAKQARPDVLADSDPWSNDSLLRAWEWLDSSHETKVVERHQVAVEWYKLGRREAERRQLESEARQVEERQRKEYLHWQEQQRQQEELELKRREDEARDPVLRLSCDFCVACSARMPIEKAAEMVWEVEQNLQPTAAGAAEQVLGTPPCPQVPHRFAAQMTFVSTDSGYPAKGPGFFAQAVDLKAMRMETIRPFLGKIKGMDTNLTMLSIGNHSWDLTGFNQPMCRVLPMFGTQRFHDMFAWAANPALSEYVGPHVVAGHSCDLWRFRFGSKTLNQTLCADGNIPVELVISINNSSGTTVKKMLASYQFSQVTSQVDQTLLEKPSICESLVPPCENGRDVEPVTVDAYVFHPGISAIDYNIEDQNVADLRGDALFICMDCLQNQSSFIDHNYTRISRYTLQMSPAFGQYALCNGYPDTVPPGPECVGGDPRLVGKEAPFFAGDGENRCSADSSIGFWYGLPKAGHCSAGEVPKKSAWESGCTWSILKRHKTIKQTCLLNDHHYLTFCQADFKEGKGFPRSEAALLAAFSSEDPSKGGCADIGGQDSAILRIYFTVVSNHLVFSAGRSGTPEDLAATGACAAGSPNDPRLSQDVGELDMPIFKDRTFLLAVSVLHCCAVKRKVFSHEFLSTAQLLPKQHEPKGSQSRSKAASGTPELPKPLSLLFQAIPGRLNWQPKPYMALVRMLLEVVHAEAMPPFVHAAAHKVASTAMQAAASQVRKVLQEAQCAEDAGAWLVDVFCEEWEQHKAGLPHLPEFFADPRRLAPPEGAVGVGRRSSMQRPSIVVAAQHAVRSLLMCRRLVRSLPGAVPKAEEQPGGPQWLRYSDEPLPIQLPMEASGRLREGGVVDLHNYTCSAGNGLQGDGRRGTFGSCLAFMGSAWCADHRRPQADCSLLSAFIGSGVVLTELRSLRTTELRKKCVKLLETFNPKVTTVDAYMDDAKFLEDPMIGDVELKFIHQIFYGCHRYDKLLKLFVTSFAFRVPAIAVRSEQSLYQVLAYLLFFRLDEMGLQDFRQFIFCGYGSPPAIFALMQYALDREELNNWVMQEWLKHYDPEYLDEDVLGKLHRRAEDLRPMMEEIQLKATGVAKSGGQRGPGTVKSDKKLTEFEPFNLTAVKPRLIPEPESSVLKDLTAHPVPAHINRTSLAAIEEARKRQREEEKARVAAKYSVDDEFIFETAGRRDHETIRMQLQEDADKKTMAECTFQPKAKKRIMPAEDATVRQNTTQVLREDARVRQTMLAEHDLLKQYEAELHDASEFYAWQDRMRKKDFLEEEARTKERIIQTQLARDVAAEAHEAATRMKSIQAEFQKKDLQVQLEAKEREYEADLEQKQKVVEQTTEDREKARIAEQEVLVIKQEHAEQRRREKEVDLAKKKREEDYEMERKKELIRQIRALERAPRETAKVFDRAEAPAQGFLEEMSFAELKERLIVMQEQHERRVEAKRERQLAKKELFDFWGIGSRTVHDGVLYVLALQQREHRIVTGRGIRTLLPDDACQNILGDASRCLKHGDVDAAVETVARGIVNAIWWRQVWRRLRPIALGVTVALFIWAWIVWRRCRKRKQAYAERASRLKRLVDTLHARSSSENLETTVCPVCLDCLSDTALRAKDFLDPNRQTGVVGDVELLRCGHLAHERCVSKWLSHSSTCPLCRADRPRLRSTGTAPVVLDLASADTVRQLREALDRQFQDLGASEQQELWQQHFEHQNSSCNRSWLGLDELADRAGWDGASWLEHSPSVESSVGGFGGGSCDGGGGAGGSW